MDYKYQVGQYIYTNCDIHGWFDYSIKDRIPSNTVGMIVSRFACNDGIFYLVKFTGKQKEFSTQYIQESSLKLG